MRQLIRWYRESPPRLRVVFHAGPNGAEEHRKAVAPLHRGPRRILVVCCGNVCRSPFAAGALQRHLDRSEWQVLSAGTHAAEGKPVTELMRAAAAEYGIDLSAQRSRKVTRSLLRTSELVITMSQRQAEKLLELEPAVQRRIRLLEGFSPQHDVWGLPADPRRVAAAAGEIDDPAGEGFEFHQECCRRLDTAVGQLSRWLSRREGSAPVC